jgi:hypothetical protein
MMQNEEVGQIKSEANGSLLIRHSQQTTRFIMVEPSRVFILPCPAPPPKLHYSTWWRSVARRIYRANASSVMKKLKARMQSHAQASEN